MVKKIFNKLAPGTAIFITGALVGAQIPVLIQEIKGLVNLIGLFQKQYAAESEPETSELKVVDDEFPL